MLSDLRLFRVIISFPFSLIIFFEVNFAFLTSHNEYYANLHAKTEFTTANSSMRVKCLLFIFEFSFCLGVVSGKMGTGISRVQILDACPFFERAEKYFILHL